MEQDMHTVVYSKDPYLLARISMELQMEGLGFHLQWCNVYHPFDRKYPPINYMFIGYKWGIEFHAHNCESENPVRLHLTENSYAWVLSMIIQNHK